MKTNLTIVGAKKYIKENYVQARHDISCLVKACRKVAKDNGVKPRELFFLMIENKPIEGANTHSYGFHTGAGRHLIDSTSSQYYQILHNLYEDEVLILN